jgi:hypothetical protein
MTSWGSDLRVEMIGDEILVTLPQSHYAVTYYKPKNSNQLLAKRINSNQLLAKRISDKDDPRIPMTGAEFLAKAWKLANNKAGEVGWIKARGWA